MNTTAVAVPVVAPQLQLENALVVFFVFAFHFGSYAGGGEYGTGRRGTQRYIHLRSKGYSLFPWWVYLAVWGGLNTVLGISMWGSLVKTNAYDSHKHYYALVALWTAVLFSGKMWNTVFDMMKGWLMWTYLVFSFVLYGAVLGLVSWQANLDKEATWPLFAVISLVVTMAWLLVAMWQAHVFISGHEAVPLALKTA